jgi:hypothetical protein
MSAIGMLRQLRAVCWAIILPSRLPLPMRERKQGGRACFGAC